MKTRTIILIASVLLIYTSNALGNDNQYAEAMAKNIQTVYRSESIGELQSAVNALERMAQRKMPSLTRRSQTSGTPRKSRQRNQRSLRWKDLCISFALQ